VIGLWNLRGKALFRAMEREIGHSRRLGSMPGDRSDCSGGISRVGTAFLLAAGLGRPLNLIIEKRNLEHDIALRRGYLDEHSPNRSPVLATGKEQNELIVELIRGQQVLSWLVGVYRPRLRSR
jgi:hypothetical protein